MLIIKLLIGFIFVRLIMEILVDYYQLNSLFLKMAFLIMFHLYMKTLILKKSAILLFYNRKLPKDLLAFRNHNLEYVQLTRNYFGVEI